MAFTIPNEQSVAFTPLARVFQSDIDILSYSLQGTGVVEGQTASDGLVTHSSGMTLSVASATIRVGDTDYSYGGGSIVISNGDAGGNRFDLVYLYNNAGVATLAKVSGGVATNPLPPAIVSTYVPLAMVYVPQSATSISSSNIVDKRCLIWKGASGGGGGGGVTLSAQDLEILRTGLYGSGVLWNVFEPLKIYESAAPGQSVRTTWPGAAIIEGYVAWVPAQTLNVTAAHATQPRVDLVVAYKNGKLGVVEGTAGSSPVAPSVPSHAAPLAWLDRQPNDNTISNAEITDKRIKLIDDVDGTYADIKQSVRFYEFPESLNGEYAYGNATHTWPQLWSNYNGLSPYQAGVFVAGDKEAVVLQRALPHGKWTSSNMMAVTGTPFGTTTTGDEHCAYAIAVDTDNRQHVIGNMHNSDMNDDANNDTYYARSGTGWSSSFSYKLLDGLSTEINAVTYPMFFAKTDGSLFLYHRNGTGNPEQGILRKYTASPTFQWSKVNTLFSDVVFGPYAWVPVFDRWAHSSLNTPTSTLNRLHVFWCWRRTSDVLTNESFFHMYSDDSGATWKELSTATPIATPIGLANTKGRIINSEWRNITNGVTTGSSTTITAAGTPFGATDIGRVIYATPIPAGTRIVSVTPIPGSTAVISQAATSSQTNQNFIISDNILNQSCNTCVDIYGRPHTIVYMGKSGLRTTQVLTHIYWNGSAWQVVELPDSTNGAGRSAIFATPEGGVWGLYQNDWYEHRGTIRLIDLNPDSPTYKTLTFPIAGPNLDLFSWAPTIDTEALYKYNELHINIIPQVTDTSASAYHDAINWNDQWGGTLTIPLSAIPKFARGEINPPGIEIIGTLSKTGPIVYVMQTPVGEVGLGEFNITATYQAQSQLFARIRARASCIGGTLYLQIQENPTGFAAVERGKIAYTSDTQKETPWIPLRSIAGVVSGFLRPVAYVTPITATGGITAFTMDIGRWTLPRETQ